MARLVCADSIDSIIVKIKIDQGTSSYISAVMSCSLPCISLTPVAIRIHPASDVSTILLETQNKLVCKA